MQIMLVQDAEVVRVTLPANPCRMSWDGAHELVKQLRELAEKACRFRASGEYKIPGIKIVSENAEVEISVAGGLKELILPGPYVERIAAGLFSCATRAELHAKSHGIIAGGTAVLHVAPPAPTS